MFLNKCMNESERARNFSTSHSSAINVAHLALEWVCVCEILHCIIHFGLSCLSLCPFVCMWQSAPMPMLFCFLNKYVMCSHFIVTIINTIYKWFFFRCCWEILLKNSCKKCYFIPSLCVFFSLVPFSFYVKFRMCVHRILDAIKIDYCW